MVREPQPPGPVAGLAKEPDGPEAFLLGGQAREEQGDHDRAIADYSFALQLDVSRALAFAQRVLAAAARGHLDSRAVDAVESLRLNQRLARTYSLRAGAYARLGDWARTASDFTQVLQLEPGNG